MGEDGAHVNTIKREYGCDLTLVVQSQDGEAISLETKGDVPLRRILLDYCHQKGLIYEVVRFLYDGTRIREDQTPDELEMEDGDIIDANCYMIGGGRGSGPYVICSKIMP